MLKTIILFPFIWYGSYFILFYTLGYVGIIEIILSGVVSYFIAEAIIKKIFNKSKTSIKRGEKATTVVDDNQSTDAPVFIARTNRALTTFPVNQRFEMY